MLRPRLFNIDFCPDEEEEWRFKALPVQNSQNLCTSREASQLHLRPRLETVTAGVGWRFSNGSEKMRHSANTCVFVFVSQRMGSRRDYCGHSSVTEPCETGCSSSQCHLKLRQQGCFRSIKITYLLIWCSTDFDCASLLCFTSWYIQIHLMLLFLVLFQLYTCGLILMQKWKVLINYQNRF